MFKNEVFLVQKNQFGSKKCVWLDINFLFFLFLKHNTLIFEGYFCLKHKNNFNILYKYMGYYKNIYVCSTINKIFCFSEIKKTI